MSSQLFGFYPAMAVNGDWVKGEINVIIPKAESQSVVYKPQIDDISIGNVENTRSRRDELMLLRFPDASSI